MNLHFNLRQHSSAMEAGDHFKNGASSKSQTSRRNYLLNTLLLFFSLLGLNAVAQDVIVMKSGVEIQAFVQEIGIDNVKYKKLDNPDGPNYTLRQSDIVLIRFANGSTESFSENTETETEMINRQNRPQNQQNRLQNQQNRPQNQSYQSPNQQNQSQNRQYQSPNQQNQSRNQPYQNRPYQSQNRPYQSQDQQDPATDYAAFTHLRKNDIAMEDFLWENDEAFYNQFHKGVKLRRTGKGLLGAGLGASIAGLGLMIGGTVIYDNADTYEDEDAGVAMVAVGSIGFVVGQVLVITSIPLSAVGGGLKKRAADGYEDKYFGNRKSGYHSSLDFTFTGNGVGLAFRF